jgi:sortase A
MRALRKLEAFLLISGLALLTIYVSALVHGSLLSRIELQQFMQARHVPETATSGDVRGAGDSPDFKLWAKGRIAAYEQSLSAHMDPPLAVLTIPKIDLKVPLLEGTDELALNRGVGHIAGTGLPGKDGNIGIAGHRDGFFRGLKDIEVGDEIDLLLPHGSATYTVDRITIVDPGDVSVLDAGSRPALTLVTCYPFYFIGSAPQRYIVHAAMKDNRASDDSNSKSSDKAAENGRTDNQN